MLQIGIMAIMLAFTITSATSQAHIQQNQIPDKSKMASIIIDDFGNNMKGTEEIIGLPYPLTVAVMPFLPTSKADAEAAHLAGKEVIIHLPMEPMNGNRSNWLGPGVITTQLSDDEIRKRVDAAINNIPHAIGINNHMGSKVTADARVMRIVLEQCKKHKLFFVDSHTNYHSIACQTAQEVGVPCIENEMFLDDQHTLSHVTKQILLIHQRLQTRNYCIAIGHVGTGGKTTAAALKSKLPDLTDYVQFVPISKLISLKYDGLTE